MPREQVMFSSFFFVFYLTITIVGDHTNSIVFWNN